jgi:hypothetical protein
LGFFPVFITGTFFAVAEVFKQKEIQKIKPFYVDVCGV